MYFRAKKIAYNKMQGIQHFEADQALLKKLKPDHPMASKTANSDKNKEKLQREIIWALLALSVSVLDIEGNRKNFGAGSEETELKLIIDS